MRISELRFAKLIAIASCMFLSATATAAVVSAPSSASAASSPSRAASSPDPNTPTDANGNGDPPVATPTYFEQGILVRSGETVQALGPNLMGDMLNEYSGGLSFSHTDVSLPGNNALPVAVGRRLATGARQTNQGTGLFGDWDLEIPHMRTVVLGQNPDWYGWNSSTGLNQNRCSEFAVPPSGTRIQGNRTIGLHPASWWDGHQLVVPGAGDQTLFSRAGGTPTNPIQPTDNVSYPVLTKQFWQLSCLPSLERGSGQGFLARSPDGTRYQFDHMVQRSYPSFKIAPADQGSARLELWILPTLITDRFGNWVRYTYAAGDGWRVSNITSSDGRTITFSYNGVGNRIQSVSDGTRTWTYGYDVDGALQTVTLPDNSKWQFALKDLERDPTFAPDPTCGSPSNYTWDYTPHLGTITHPSGAQGTFTLLMTQHGRSNVPGAQSDCDGLSPVNLVSSYFNNYALTKKSLVGPGMPVMTWNYVYNGGCGSFSSFNNCDGTKSVSITDPLNNVFRKTFGTEFGRTEGLLLLSTVESGSSTLQTSTYNYAAPTAGPFPGAVGFNGPWADSMGRIYTPQIRRDIVRQSVTMTQVVTSMDQYARPTGVRRQSSLGYLKDESTAYRDHLSKWILGQMESRTIAGVNAASTTFDATTALPVSSSKFGKLQAIYTFDPDGTLTSITDGLNKKTTFSSYVRGLPQTISYADGTRIASVVNNIGAITSVTNEANTTWNYGYDLMGRLSSKVAPTGDAVPYNATLLSFEQVPSAEYDLEANHWRQKITTGNATTYNYFDARWRKRLTLTYDAAFPTVAPRMESFSYDPYSRVTFASYPAHSIGSINSTPPGTRTYYDALGRPTQTQADSERGVLTTTFQYLDGFRKQVINARGQVTTTEYQVFDDPEDAAPVVINAPEGLKVTIARDMFGKPTSITRSGTYAGSGVAATRSYVYDQNQLLCKTIEPESGATVQALDAANNVVWRATGLPLPSTTACDFSSVQ